MSELILPESVKKYRQEHGLASSIQVDNVVVTSVDTVRGAIVTNTYAIMEDDVVDSMVRIVETQDDQVRNALISLGWTPPDSTLQGVQ